jgi:hypothetical protein
LKLLSFPPFSLQRQRKGGAAPHRGNANRPNTKSGCPGGFSKTQTQKAKTGAKRRPEFKTEEQKNKEKL